MRLKDIDLFTRLLRTRPLFTAVLFFMLGCVFACETQLSMLFWVALAAIAALLVVLARHNKRLLAAMLIVLMLPIGAIRFNLAWTALAPVEDQADIHLTGRIADDPFYNAETGRCICVLEDVTLNGEDFVGRLRLYLRGDTELLQNVRLAQHVSCTAKLWQGDAATNPDEFSFGDYLRINGLKGYATAKIEDSAFTEAKYRFSDLNNLVRARISRRIDRFFPENAAIVKAFILGDRSEMDAVDKESFNKSGAAHLLAISGMHISVLAMLVSWLLGRFLKRSHAFVLTASILILYCWLIGPSPSLLRACIMFALYGFSAIIGRYSDSPTRLAFAALLHLLLAPLDILSASFILSYSASAGIVLLSRPLSRLLRCDALLEGGTGHGFRALICIKLPRAVMRSIVTSLAATIATFPAVIYFFGAQPLWSMLVNLCAVPLAMLAYILSIAGTILGFAPVCLCSDLLFGLLTGLVRIVSALPFASLCVARLPLWLSGICALMCLLASELSALPEKLRRILPVCTLLAMLLSNGMASIELHRDGFVFFDAGQADCAMLKTGGNLYFFDVGDSYTPAADYLSARNRDIDAVFLSHPHSDHAGGLDSILDICTPERIYISDNYDAYEVDESISEALKRAEILGSEIITIKTGDIIQLSSKSFVKVLAPDAGISNISANEDSLVLYVDCGQTSALFTGDMPANGMPENLPDIDILKVSHHGSRSSLDARTLTELSPSIAIIPVEDGNLYGHPAQKTVDLLQAAGTTVLRTDVCGAINVTFSEDSTLEISTYNNFGGTE